MPSINPFMSHQNIKRNPDQEKSAETVTMVGLA